LRDTVHKLGGFRASTRFALHRMMYAFGAYRHYHNVDWRSVRRLVFVCSGNICRSPYAAEAARACGIDVASFGTQSGGARPANETARVIAEERGIDLSAHASTRQQDYQVAEGDLLVAMEPRHARAISHLVRPGRAQVTLAGLWCNPEKPFLPDPYGAGRLCFEFVFQQIDESLTRMLSHLSAARKDFTQKT
jgi:protein-tyrosine phosphatase